MFAYNSQQAELKGHESSADEESQVKLKSNNVSERKTKVPDPGKGSGTIEMED
jgi:hypothetical protein